MASVPDWVVTAIVACSTTAEAIASAVRRLSRLGMTTLRGAEVAVVDVDDARRLESPTMPARRMSSATAQCPTETPSPIVSSA